MVRLVLRIRASGSMISIELIEHTGLLPYKLMLIMGSSLLLGNGSDYYVTKQPRVLRDRYVEQITNELFNGQKPTVEGDIYIWQN